MTGALAYFCIRVMLFQLQLNAGIKSKCSCTLDRRLADRRVWPSIDISQSGTRREELLHDEETYEAVTMLRRTLSSMHPCDAMEQLTTQLGRFESNEEFIKLISGAKLAN